MQQYQPKSKSKSGGGSKKIGRNKKKCERYFAEGRRELNKKRKAEKRRKKHEKGKLKKLKKRGGQNE